MRRFLGFTAVLVIAELLIIIGVADLIGVLNMIGLLILAAVLGVLVVKAQGLATLRRVVDDVDARRVPAATLANGALCVTAGILLVVPGFLTDILGLLLLVPGVRTGVRRYLGYRWTRRFVIVRGDAQAARPVARRALGPPADQ
jgi:UPF0716 protein FxsA